MYAKLREQIWQKIRIHSTSDQQLNRMGNPVAGETKERRRMLIRQHAGLQDIDIKYIDPTYMIRAIPTTTNDRIYCKVLGQGAVHGAFAGFTGCTVGLVNTHYVYLPIPVIIQVPSFCTVLEALFTASSIVAASHSTSSPGSSCCIIYLAGRDRQHSVLSSALTHNSCNYLPGLHHSLLWYPFLAVITCVATCPV